MPTIFPKYLQPKPVKKRKSPRKRLFIEPETILQPSPSKLAKISASDHAYANTQGYPDVELSELKKQVKTLKQKVRRRNKKVKSLKDLLQSLRDKQLIALEQHDLLTHNFNEVAKHLFKDQMKNSKDAKQGNRYSLETKQFAMTLHYYSPKAYEFTRKVLSLPHSSTIRTWATSVDCEPGFLQNVIKLIGGLVQKKGWMSDCVLIVDAMALYKGTTWDPKTKTYVGLVDYGTAKPEPEENLATEALVFMIASITGHWKHPIAYFLQDKCSAAVQAQLIKDCIGLLHTEGLDVTALVFDGTFTNQSTAKLLGCKMKVSERQTWFPHPQIFGAKVFVIFF